MPNILLESSFRRLKWPFQAVKKMTAFQKADFLKEIIFAKTT